MDGWIGLGKRDWRADRETHLIPRLEYAKFAIINMHRFCSKKTTSVRPTNGVSRQSKAWLVLGGAAISLPSTTVYGHCVSTCCILYHFCLGSNYKLSWYCDLLVVSLNNLRVVEK